MSVEDYSIRISLKNKFQLFQLRQRKLSFFTFPIISLWKIDLSCHNIQRSHPTRIKNIIYVQANFLSMYAKFQPQPPYGFLEDFIIFFKKLPFMSPWQPMKLSDLHKSHMKRGELLNKHICG